MLWRKLALCAGLVLLLAGLAAWLLIPRFSGHLVVARHGESEANKAGIIASQFETAGLHYGLTYEGAKQVESAAWQIKAIFPGADFVLVTSPFLRTRQSATIMSNILRADPVIVDTRLSERNFSAFELQSASNYEAVWSYDRAGQRLTPVYHGRVEELDDVRNRTQAAIREYKNTYNGRVVVFVTHGDVASNIITTAKGEPLSRHREFGNLDAGHFTVVQSP